MARILDCWELGNGLAYIEGLALGAKLMSKAGHEAMFAGRDLTHAERTLGSKVRYFQAPTQVIPISTPLPSPMTFADVLINLGYGNPDSVVARVRAWRNLMDQVKPDIIRCAHAPAALLAARGTGIRTMVLGIGFIVPPKSSPLPLLRTWAKNTNPERMAAREQGVLSGMNRGLDSIGAPRVASIGALYAETDVRLLYTYPELDEYGPRQDVRYLGNLQAALGEAPAWPEAPGKRIFAYLEPLKPVSLVLKALADTRQPVLVYMPHTPEELLTQYAGTNVRITDHPLNLMRTATECDFGVSHGGHNIAATLLWAGKPQLTLPTLFPERVIGEKVAAMGAGLVSQLQQHEIERKLTKLMQDPSLAEKARGFSQRVTGMSIEAGLQEFMACIDSLVEAGPKV